MYLVHGLNYLEYCDFLPQAPMILLYYKNIAKH